MAGAIYHDNTTAWSTINSSAYEVGMAFHVTASVDCTGLQWYRSFTGAGHAPEIVRLWRAGDTTELGRLVSVPDTGEVGWQGANLATPITLVTGQIYIVSGYYPGSGGQPSRSDIASTPDAPVVVESSFRRYLAGSAGFPVNADSGSAIGADVLLTVIDEGGGDTPATAAEVGTELAKWLSTDGDVQTHEADGIPWYLKLLVDAWNSGLGAGATGYFAFMKTALLAVKERTDRLPDSIEALTNAILDAGVAETEAIQANLALIQAGVDALTGGSGGTAGGALGALSGRSAFPTTGWSMADETDWDTDLAWPVAADLYVFTVTTPPPGAAADSFAGVTWYHRLGSWTTLDGDQAGARAFLEFSPQQLQDGGRRMPGLALRTKNGTLGHVQAWLLA